MLHNLDFTDRRTRRDAGLDHRQGTRYVLAGQKDYYDPANATDVQEYRIVRSYGRR